jgi:hypothetical protein
MPKVAHVDQAEVPSDWYTSPCVEQAYKVPAGTADAAGRDAWLPVRRWSANRVVAIAAS